MLVTASGRIAGGLFALLRQLFQIIILQVLDSGITVLNFFLPHKHPAVVIPPHLPGGEGVWPEFIPPLNTDSRSPCPALNALANHGILPRDGRKIPFTVLSKSINDTFNFSTTFSWFVPHYAAQMLGRDYAKDTVDLNDLCVHNGIEHDASLTRLDAFEEPDQSIPNHDLIDRLLACATGKDPKTGEAVLTNADVARFTHLRRSECKLKNPQYMLDFFHKIFGSNNSATMTVIFGGRVKDLNVFLKEERFPEGWQPRKLDRLGLSMAMFNQAVFSIEWRIPETLHPSHKTPSSKRITLNGKVKSH